MENQINSALKSIAKGAVISFFALIIGKIIGLVTRVVVARYLGPHEYGLLSLGFSIASITAVLVVLGLQQAVLRFLPYYKDEKENYDLIVPTAIKIVLPIALVVSIILFSSARLIAIQLFQENQLIAVLRIFAIMIPFSAMSQIFLSALQALKKVKETVITREIILSAVQLILIFVLFGLSHKLIGAAVAYISAYIAIAILSLCFLLKQMDIKIYMRSNKEIIKKLMIYSTPLILATVVTTVFRQTDLIFLGIFKTSSDVGVYAAVFPLAQTIKFIGASIAFLLIPIITELFARQKFDEIKTLYKTASRWSAFVALPFGVILIVFPNQIIHIFYGENYVSGRIALIILALTYIIHSTLWQSYDLVTAAGETKKIFIAILIGFSLNFVLNILLIPKYGGIGAAVGTLCSIISTIVITTYFAYKIFRFTHFSKGIIKAMTAAVIAAVIIYFINLKTDTNFIILSIIFLVIYITFLILLRSFAAEDLRVIIALRNKLGIKLYWLEKILKRFI